MATILKSSCSHCSCTVILTNKLYAESDKIKKTITDKDVLEKIGSRTVVICQQCKKMFFVGGNGARR